MTTLATATPSNPQPGGYRDGHIVPGPPLRVPYARQAAGVHAGGAASRSRSASAPTPRSSAIVNAVLLRPLPYHEPDRVVLLWSHWTNWTKTWVSEPELADYQQQARSLEHVAAFSSTSFNLTGGGEPLRVRAAQVQAEIFAALGAKPIAGRVFTRGRGSPGRTSAS